MKGKKYTVYGITCNCGKVWVGKTIDLQTRQRGHRYDCFNGNSYSYNSRICWHFRNCGLTPKTLCLLPLEEELTRYEAIESEWMFINTMGELNHDLL